MSSSFCTPVCVFIILKKNCFVFSYLWSHIYFFDLRSIFFFFLKGTLLKWNNFSALTNKNKTKTSKCLIAIKMMKSYKKTFENAFFRLCFILLLLYPLVFCFFSIFIIYLCLILILQKKYISHFFFTFFCCYVILLLPWEPLWWCSFLVIAPCLVVVMSFNNSHPCCFLLWFLVLILNDVNRK